MGRVLDVVSLVADVGAWVSWLVLRVALWRVCGWFAVANLVLVPAEVVAGERVGGCVNAGVGAMDAAIWWTGGGGDGTRRRLRALARAFRGVRRTAPVTAGGS